jgi:predicted ATPase
MINYIYLKNFKAFREVDISPASLNIFAGLNGMGKSTFLQALLLLRQSYLQNTLLDKGLLLNGDYLELGKGKDVYSQYGTDDNLIVFEVEWNEKIKLERKFQRQDEVDLLPINHALTDSDPKEILQQSLFTHQFQYLNAERISPKDFFPASAFHIEQLHSLGNHGQFTVHFIAKNQRKEIPIKALAHPKEDSLVLLDQLDAWMGEMTPGIKLASFLYDEFEIARLSYQFEVGKNSFTESIRPTNVGFGLTYILPIVTAVISARPGDLLIIENPESHLHPQGQALLGRLFALAAENDVQLFIETHSDHILNGVRVAVKQKQISPDKVGIFFFERDLEAEEHVTHIIQPYIDENGRLDKKPKGFFDEWGKQLDELLK